MKLHKSTVPPKWIVEPEDQSVILGNSVVIPCQAEGSPPPTLLWKQAIGNNNISMSEKIPKNDIFIHKLHDFR